MKKKLLSFPLLCLYSSKLCFAAAFELSGQTIQPFFEPKNYAEFSLAYIQPQVSGQVQHSEALQQFGVTDFSTGNFSNKQVMMGAALKLELNPQVKFAIIYDQPFAVDIDYRYRPIIYGEKHEIEAASINFKSHNLTTLLGYQIMPNWDVYGGLSYQSLEGSLNMKGKTYSVFDGYDADFKKDEGLGWLTGISYQMPEYHFRTSLTYRSPIKHQLSTTESIKIGVSTPDTTHIKTPQSVNFDFMTGLPYQNLLYGSVRWVNWEEFVIHPPKFEAVIDYAAIFYPEVKDIKLISYKEDQWSTKLGLAHLWNEKWISALELLWDSGTNNPASTLNPSDGYKGIGLAGMYKLRPELNIAMGLYYFHFDTPKAPNDSNPFESITGLSALNDNDAWAFGIRFAHHF
ncbi:transport of long-chain fatty acid [Acinetobacter sp. ANC 4204]|jgi:long-chain fatty acid transport protein|uniref:outer membrane protein transport protein n=1 Tax=unclassified Acinetobacter TaxID=196816 RepID=UPI000A334140|nr:MULTISPECIES: outer membrane protein transport protein [unclassified Acinetobacter]OTG59803.1 transport of long-chain fatty acid [Acinetobacter sp. ANC 4204]